MSDKTSRFLGVVVIAMGLLVLMTSHTLWGLRGIAYVGYGIFMIGRTFKDAR